MTVDSLVALVVTDTLGEIIVNQLKLIEATARPVAVDEAQELVLALSLWAETNGASDIELALQQLATRIESDAVADKKLRQQSNLH